jgi:cellobiose-specific phosphotransferase system component IIA
LPTNPHREELRKAIDRRATALDRLDVIKIAQRQEVDARGVQRRALADAIGGLAAAETDSAKQAARATIEKARDELNEAVKEQRRLEKQYAAAENDLQDAIREVAARVRDVVHSDPATQRLASEFVDLQRQISELRPVMEILSSAMLPDGFRFWRAEPGPPPHNLVLEAWERAIAALHADPDAELPFDIFQTKSE